MKNKKEAQNVSVEELLEKMTLDEILQQLTQQLINHSKNTETELWKDSVKMWIKNFAITSKQRKSKKR